MREGKQNEELWSARAERSGDGTLDRANQILNKKAPSPLRPAVALQSLLLSAFTVRARRLRLRRVVDFARFHDVSLIVELSAAINVDLHDDFVRFTIVNIVWFECQAVLAAQHCVDRTEHVGQLAFESYRIKSSATLFGESRESIICL